MLEEAYIRLIYLLICDTLGLWETVAPYAARNFAHLSVVSSRQHSDVAKMQRVVSEYIGD